MGVKRQQPDLGEDTARLEPLSVADVICSCSERLPWRRDPGWSGLSR